LRFTEETAEPEVLFYSRRWQILLLQGLRLGKITAIIVTNSSLV
jgi:hypothetical protein